MENKRTVYIETSVVSYYTGKTSRDLVVAGHQVSTKEFWDRLTTEEFIPVISALVIKEASQGNIEQAEKRKEALQGFHVLDISEESENLASFLVTNNGVPAEFLEDALHIAVASVAKIDFIATWNFKHMNNPFTKEKIRKIIEDSGYSCPVIISPEELLGVEP